MYPKCFNKLELKLELHTNQAAKTGGKETAFLMVSWHPLFCYLLYCGYAHIQDSVSILWGKGLQNDAENN